MVRVVCIGFPIVLLILRFMRRRRGGWGKGVGMKMGIGERVINFIIWEGEGGEGGEYYMIKKTHNTLTLFC